MTPQRCVLDQPSSEISDVCQLFMLTHVWLAQDSAGLGWWLEPLLLFCFFLLFPPLISLLCPLLSPESWLWNKVKLHSKNRSVQQAHGSSLPSAGAFQRHGDGQAGGGERGRAAGFHHARQQDGGLRGGESGHHHRHGFRHRPRLHQQPHQVATSHRHSIIRGNLCHCFLVPRRLNCSINTPFFLLFLITITVAELRWLALTAHAERAQRGSLSRVIISVMPSSSRSAPAC